MSARVSYRQVKLGALDPRVERRADGTMVVRSAQRLARYPEKMTECLERWAEAAPGRVFLAQRAADGAWRTVTYAEALSAVRALGQALLNAGLTAERGLAVLSGNDIEHGLLMLAAQYVGVPYAPISTAYSLVSTDFGKLRHTLGLFTPSMVFASDARYAKAIRTVVPNGVTVVLTDPSGADLPCLSYAELAAARPTGAVDDAHAKVGPDTVAKVLFTSGSTGMPKGVINTQRVMCSNQEVLRHLFAFVQDEPPVLVDWLPWNHTFGGNHNFNLALYNGGTFHIDDGKPVPKGIAATIANLREIAPTIYFNVPKGYEALLPFLDGDEALRQRFFSRLNLLFYAGAGLAPHVWSELEELGRRTTGHPVVMVTGLGATETGPMALNANRPYAGPGRIGLPVPEVEVKLIPNAEKLECRFRGPGITPGYWRQPELTAVAFDEEGFYKIGDAIRFADPDRLEEGFVFDGRISEDFKLATGTWVSVGALRAAIIQHFAPFVSDVVVAGHDRDDVRVLLLPDVFSCRDLCPHFAVEDNLAELMAEPMVRSCFQALIDSFAARSTGSSNRVAALMLLDTPPSLDSGEITDKGSLNQRNVLRHRVNLVEALYREDDPRVIRVSGSNAPSGSRVTVATTC